MKRIFAYLLLAFASTITFAATETYQIDPAHSYVAWRISHFGFSHPTGKWYVNGSIQVDEADPTAASVKVTIPIADINTGIPKLDEHLKGSDFFDVAKYPTATFVSTKIEKTGESTGKLYGDLTLHGVTKPVILDVKLNKVGMSPVTNKKTAGFSGTANLKRSDFGIKAYLPNLGDEIPLVIEVEATKST